MASSIRYSELLEGRILDQGWRVIRKLPKDENQTGGRFSVCYDVESETGSTGFLKAVDLTWALDQEDFTRALEHVLQAHNFEKDLLLECRDRRMDRIVQPLADGVVTVDPDRRESRVPYIIFEKGEGDIRVILSRLSAVEIAVILKLLHHVAVGLQQLHRAQIAHQDLKPSNVVVFPGQDGKIGDLGHAVRKGVPLVRPEHHTLGGDPTHAPLEQLYGAVPADWATHRQGGDLYHLGSLATFLFTGTTMTARMHAELHEPHWPRNWSGSFDGVLPHLRSAFERVLQALRLELPAEVAHEVLEAVKYLCDPDPSRRGHPTSRAMRNGDPMSLERFVAKFALLARTVSRKLVVELR